MSANKGGNKKRKRQYDDDEKLEHQCMKDINREVKKMKTFVMQKAVKSLAKWKERLEGETTVESKSQDAIKENMIKTLEEIETLKQIDVKELVLRAARSIGLRPKEIQMADIPPFAFGAVDIETVMKRRVLESKRLVKALEPLEQKVMFRRQEKLCIEDGGSLKKLLRRQRKAAGKKANMDPMRAARSNESAVFCESLSGGAVDYGEEEGEQDDFASLNKNEKGWEEEDSFAVKKNRPGQRARQKRHEEEEVRKQKKAGTWVPPMEGEKVDLSRTDLKRPTAGKGKGGKGEGKGKGGKGSGGKGGGKGEGKGGGKGGNSSNSSSSSSGGKGGGPPEGMHASWAAKQAQKEKAKSAVGAFSGKKITFD
jgi:hypothetical protein